MSAEKIAPRRASEFSPGIGYNVDDPEHNILGKDVVVHKFWVGERNYNGELRPIVIIYLEDGTIYHAWSASLADKIAEIPEDAYPLVFTFVKSPTRKYASGVITFE